ncbi:MAG: Hint domain-containing protein [Acidisphaera sp.]|nr:Hint domain-containing protein [Acidisphaera sp.]
MTFTYAIDLQDPHDLGGSDDAGLVTDLAAAAADWSQYIAGAGTLVIALDFAALGSGVLANGGATVDIGNGGTLDGRTLLTPSSIYELTTGQHVQGYTTDITVTVSTEYLDSLYIDPDPADGDAVPAGEYDALSLLRHELAHGFGFGGATTSSGSLGSEETLWDHYLQKNPDGTADFVGPTAESVYGGPVPITTLDNGEAYSHVGNSADGPLGQDLMNGVGMQAGRTYDISSVDLAMLSDVGVPVSSYPQDIVPCFCAGTRILTPDGEVPVEDLRVGDHVRTASGAAVPIVWIGRRRVDCRGRCDPTSVSPIRISAGAFAAGRPARDLLLSPDHAVYAEGVLIPARHLVNDASIRREAAGIVQYLHLELPAHDVLLAEGLPVESYLDTGNRMQLEPGISPARPARISCAPLRCDGQHVARVRRRLRARAALRTLPPARTAAPNSERRLTPPAVPARC